MTLRFTPISEIQQAYEKQRLLSKQRVVKTAKQRIEQLKRLRKSIAKHESEILEALQMDLGKSNYEGFLTEVGVTYQEIDFHIKHVKHWSAHQRISTPWFLLPSSSKVIPNILASTHLKVEISLPYKTSNHNPLIHTNS